MFVDCENDRRHHVLYVTKNTEYHMQDSVCVGVRDVQSHIWRNDHHALGLDMLGGVRYSSEGFCIFPKPGLGLGIWFRRDGIDIITTTVQQICRPDRGAVENYHVPIRQLLSAASEMEARSRQSRSTEAEYPG